MALKGNKLVVVIDGELPFFKWVVSCFIFKV